MMSQSYTCSVSLLRRSLAVNLLRQPSVVSSAQSSFSSSYFNLPLSRLPSSRSFLSRSLPLLLNESTVDRSPSNSKTIKWVKPDGSTVLTTGYVGQTLLQVAHENGIELEGACEGVCACSTCHSILTQRLYAALPPPSEEEEDMLDMAFGLKPTSRLGCQVKVFEGDVGEWLVELPRATRNFYVDGHVPKPH